MTVSLRVTTTHLALPSYCQVPNYISCIALLSMYWIFSKLPHKQLILCKFNKTLWEITSQQGLKTCQPLLKSRAGSDKLRKGILSQRATVTSMSEHGDNVFKGTPDRYQGITVDSTEERCDPHQFLGKLEESLRRWHDGGVRGVWFKIALEHAALVPFLAQHSFVFHHAQREYLMMYRWLPADEDSNIPRFAHTMIGVGAVVISAGGEVLVVRERHAFKGFPHWKLPGGYLDTGEDIEDAAVREVLEETSIETQFEFLISFRHTHGANFGCSDLYFIVGLTPTTTEIKKCDREIVAAEWMKLDEYLSHPHVHETNRFFVEKYLECKRNGSVIGSTKGTHPLLKRPFTVFNIDDAATLKKGNVPTSKYKL